mmetsp:Transcript_7814/g.32874  ORF Transcript_7814/g.32874 Transcript_7814/m.32874 type:complete len:242 (+) Transcript_7814:390-1115(+)
MHRRIHVFVRWIRRPSTDVTRRPICSSTFCMAKSVVRQETCTRCSSLSSAASMSCELPRTTATKLSGVTHSPSSSSSSSSSSSAAEATSAEVAAAVSLSASAAADSAAALSTSAVFSSPPELSFSATLSSALPVSASASFTVSVSVSVSSAVLSFSVPSVALFLLFAGPFPPFPFPLPLPLPPPFPPFLVAALGRPPASEGAWAANTGRCGASRTNRSPFCSSSSWRVSASTLRSTADSAA